MDIARCRKREFFRIWEQHCNEEDRKKVCASKKDVKREVYMVMDEKAREAVEKAGSCCDGCELFKIVKQRVGEKKDVVGVSCLKDESGAVKVSLDDQNNMEGAYGKC